MSSPDIVVRINRKSVYVFAALVAVAALGRLVWSETLTLATTYPSPAGIYNYLVTTGNSATTPANTTLNRNAGNTILVPDTNAAGKVGIGTTNPNQTLHVKGTFRLVDGTEAAGKVLTSNGSGKAAWAAPPTMSSSYAGICSAPPGGSCKCNNGELIMLLMGNSAGSTGYCSAHNQGQANVFATCDGATAAPSVFACFR